MFLSERKSLEPLTKTIPLEENIYLISDTFGRTNDISIP